MDIGSILDLAKQFEEHDIVAGLDDLERTNVAMNGNSDAIRKLQREYDRRLGNHSKGDFDRLTSDHG